MELQECKESKESQDKSHLSDNSVTVRQSDQICPNIQSANEAVVNPEDIDCSIDNSDHDASNGGDANFSHRVGTTNTKLQIDFQ